MSFMVFIEKKYICLKRKTDFRRKKGKLILEYTTTCHLQKKKLVLWSNMCNGKVLSWMFDGCPNTLLSKVIKMQFDGTRGMTVKNQNKVKVLLKIRENLVSQGHAFKVSLKSKKTK